jgi:hypothetical protein
LSADLDHLAPRVRYEERGQAVCERLKRIRTARMIGSSEASATASNR